LSLHFVCVAVFKCFASSITSSYVKIFAAPYVQKASKTCDGAVLMVTSISLMKEWLSEVAMAATVYRVSKFTAAYARDS